jgi:short-subunit dehydrogenase
MRLKEKYGPWACVAGAGEGLGKAFSEGLAKRGFNLILIDHKVDLLDSLKISLESSYQVEVICLHLDLAEKNSVETILETINNQQCRLLIYNAAYGPVKPFLSNTSAEIDRYLNVNIVTQLHLIHQFINSFQAQSAGVLMVSSLAGFRGTQFVIPYAATKSFIWNMAEGLHYEFKKTNLDFSVCVPGATDTPNFRSTNPRKNLFAPTSQNPSLVAEEALNQFGKKLFIIPGTSNKISHFVLNRLLPRRIASGIHNATMKKMYG